MKIAITGPESTGKSTLSQSLSKMLNIPIIEEYARAYFEQNQISKYDLMDFLHIANYQNKIFQKHQQYSFIADTEFIVLAIWAKEKYNYIPQSIFKSIAIYNFDYYFLCAPTIPWESDALRENPHDRFRLFDLYEEMLQSCGIKYHVIDAFEHAERVKHVESIIRHP
ncbi:MAG: ATP-binding protein [Saprospiraceae bacterium]|nr:ATP-binding protein [Saprospiraceae bacterium]